MTKEVVVRAWCDGDHESQVPATVERTIRVDDYVPTMVDLCPVCDKVIEDLIGLLGQGAPVDPPALKRGGRRRREDMPKDCREPGCVDPRTGEPYVAPTRSALGQHIKQRHNKKLSDYDWSD